MTVGRLNPRVSAALAAGLCLTAVPAGAQTATWYIGTYSQDILVWDEATEEVVDRIRIRNLVPNRMQASADRTRLYVGEASGERIEIVDLATREVVDELTLSEDSVTVRIESYTPHPSDEKLGMLVKRYTKHVDRFSVEGPFLVEYDLEQKRVSDTIPWPDGRSREGAGLQYSPDGETLYLFMDDVVALDADSHAEVDRWEISRPLEPGTGRASFDIAPGTYDEEGVTTSLFRMTDPLQSRRMLGIARVRLSERDVDFFVLGGDEPVGQFALAPGGERAYALLETIGRYEFWEFDLVGRRLVRRQPFAGRPRMGLRVSADGRRLFVFIAGNTIDVYDVESFELLRTVAFDEDMRPSVVIPGPAPGR